MHDFGAHLESVPDIFSLQERLEVSRLKKKKYDGVFIDVNPEIDSEVELLKKIQKALKRDSTVIIAVIKKRISEDKKNTICSNEYGKVVHILFKPILCRSLLVFLAGIFQRQSSISTL